MAGSQATMPSASACASGNADFEDPSAGGGGGGSQLMMLDFFFPGFSVLSTALQKYLHVDLNVYIPLVVLCGGLTFLWRYFSEYLWSLVESYLMATVDVRTDDELYNYMMSWVATQTFAQGARRFIANTNLSSRSWFLFRWDSDEDEEGEDDNGGSSLPPGTKRKPLAYTPTFGSHYFWYKGRILVFRRNQNRDQGGFLPASEREEISVSCFGRDPRVLKELLHEARDAYMRRDESKTLIYRGTTRSGSTEPTWQRSMARTTRPLSTVVLDEAAKKSLIDDVTDYLDPATRRWYSNRGIPYRRGYLLYGPPGTGKSSLSLALAGFFRMRIYIVSLSSVTASEENLASLFAELPRRCVVLLEDIDTAGLTHTREGAGLPVVSDAADDMVPGQTSPGISDGSGGRSAAAAAAAVAAQPSGRLSLSGLLNILDGVASQEGRVLIMTTNHLEKLDKALIRPGRVDMIVKFDRADAGMTAAIFRAIFAPLEGDDPVVKEDKAVLLSPEERAKSEAAAAAKKAEVVAEVDSLAEEFAALVPETEFSPAELQGFLLKHKRDPRAAVAGVAQWMAETRREKEDKKSEEAAKKKKEAEEAAAKKKEEEDAAKKKAEEEAAAAAKKKAEEEAAAAAKKKADEDEAAKTKAAEAAAEATSKKTKRERKREEKERKKRRQAAKRAVRVRDDSTVTDATSCSCSSADASDVEGEAVALVPVVADKSSVLTLSMPIVVVDQAGVLDGAAQTLPAGGKLVEGVK